VIAYVDASVLLRALLGQSNALADWRRIQRAVSSELIRVECLRTMDRLRLRAQIDERAYGRRRGEVLEALEAIELVPLAASILARASNPFPTSLGTLDAIHLATALEVRAHLPELVLTTHDEALGLAGGAMGFEVRGLD
jgi:predicted nucleic acid-binding protein